MSSARDKLHLFGAKGGKSSVALGGLLGKFEQICARQCEIESSLTCLLVALWLLSGCVRLIVLKVGKDWWRVGIGGLQLAGN